MKPPPDVAWMARAACVDEDPDMFFEKGGEQHAKAICRDCPVYLECGDYARAEKIDYGIWGGLNPTERCGRGRPAQPIIHGTYNGYRTHRRRNETACGPCKKAAAEYAQLMNQRDGGGRHVKCALPFGCKQWAMRGHDLCWTHAGRPSRTM